MVRTPNTQVNGRAFDSATIEDVWAKGRPIPRFSPAVWRFDRCGSVISRVEFGNTGSRHGWEIDHARPVARGGTDRLDNLQPLQWGNNRRKGDRYPWTSSGYRERTNVAQSVRARFERS